MKASLSAIQYMWWTLVAMSVLLSVCAAIALGDAKVQDALVELQTFQQAFDRPTVEFVLTETARAKGRVALQRVADAFSAEDGPRLTAEEGDIDPVGAVHIATLQEIQHHDASSHLTIGRADPEALAMALAFHLRHLGERKPVTLTEIRLEAAHNPPQDATYSLIAEHARRRRLAATQALEQAEAQYAHWTERSQRARALGAAKGYLDRLVERRREARANRSQARRDFASAQQQYARAAEQALAVSARPRHVDTTQGYETVHTAVATITLRIDDGSAEPIAQANDAAPAGVQLQPTSGLVNAERDTAIQTTLHAATVAQQPAHNEQTLQFLTSVVPWRVEVPGLSGINFAQTREAGLWDEVATLTPDAAIGHARSTFSLCSTHMQVGGVMLGMPLVMQVGPLALMLLLLAINHRAQHSARGYNPFAHLTPELRSLGLGWKPLDFASLAILPPLAGALCTAALWGLMQWPVIAAPSTLLCIGLGIWAYFNTDEARELAEAIVRTSTRPPPPAVAKPATPDPA